MNTTALKVRRILPTLLIDDDDLGMSYSGKNLVLNYPALDISTIRKDGVDVDFTFIRPDMVELSIDAAGERYIATVCNGIGDAEIEAIIEMSDRVILDAFSQYDTPAAGYLEDWSSILTAAKYLRMYVSSTKASKEQIKDLEKMVYDEMDTFKDNTSTGSDIRIVKSN